LIDVDADRAAFEANPTMTAFLRRPSSEELPGVDRAPMILVEMVDGRTLRTFVPPPLDAPHAVVGVRYPITADVARAITEWADAQWSALLAAARLDAMPSPSAAIH
jgi:hypothetical protein